MVNFLVLIAFALNAGGNKLGLRRLKTRNGRGRLLTAIGNARWCARAGRQQELAPTNNRA